MRVLCCLLYIVSCVEHYHRQGTFAAKPGLREQISGTFFSLAVLTNYSEIVSLCFSQVKKNQTRESSSIKNVKLISVVT